jgi:hypothetical protein
MRAKPFLAVLVVLFLSLFVFVFESRAGVDSVNAVDNLITAVNAGELDEALALFATDAVASNAQTRRSYAGSDEIGRLLQELHREGRQYEIVRLIMDGDRVELTVDVSEYGLVWGQQRMAADVQDGLIRNLEVLEVRLTLWRILG